MSKLTIRKITNTDPDFYPTLGPFLARRDIAKEMGGNIWDDNNKVWWVATINGQVVGFCAAKEISGKPVTWQSAYVLPAHRGQGVYRRLRAARAKHYTGQPIRVVCNAHTAPAYTADGFTVVRQRGAYTEMTRS